MNKIQKTAFQTLDKLNDSTYPDLVHYAETTLNWRVVLYHTENGDQLLRRLDPSGKLTEFAEKTHGFCYKTALSGYIFLDARQCDAEKRRTLAHEIGHIRLGHTDDSSPSVQDEIDANTFVTHLLHPNHTKYKVFRFTQLRIRLAVLLTLLLTTGVLACVCLYHPVQSPAPASGTVFVMPSGTKYHLPDCQYVNNNAVSIPIEQAVKNYLPCKICKPGK